MGHYVVLSTCKVSPEKIEPHRAEHREFLEAGLFSFELREWGQEY